MSVTHQRGRYNVIPHIEYGNETKTVDDCVCLRNSVTETGMRGKELSSRLSLCVYPNNEWHFCNYFKLWVVQQ